jgi:hypothetical protein
VVWAQPLQAQSANPSIIDGVVFLCVPGQSYALNFSTGDALLSPVLSSISCTASNAFVPLLRGRVGVFGVGGLTVLRTAAAGWPGLEIDWADTTLPGQLSVGPAQDPLTGNVFCAAVGNYTPGPVSGTRQSTHEASE